MNKLIAFTVLGLLSLTSCGPIKEEPPPCPVKNYTEITVDQLNSMTPPIVLIAKDKDLGEWGITLMDSTNNVRVFGNMSDLANQIGASRNIGDTIIPVRRSK